MIVAELLAQGCNARGISAKAFFEGSGISQPTWSRIMRGQTKMSLEDLRSGCEYLGVSMPKLLERAEYIAANLPSEKVDVIEPQGTQHKAESSNVGAVILASAALAFLISRMLK